MAKDEGRTPSPPPPAAAEFWGETAVSRRKIRWVTITNEIPIANVNNIINQVKRKETVDGLNILWRKLGNFFYFEKVSRRRIYFLLFNL